MIHDVDEPESILKRSIRELYAKLVVNVLPAARNSEKQKLHEQDAFVSFLSSVSTSERLGKSIINVLDQVENWMPAEMAQAFEGLEMYALNLLDFPWKKEFRTIHMYAGFYKTRLEPYISNPDVLLRTLGYEQTPGYKLKIIEELPHRRTLERVAFGFFLASVECRTIDFICSKVRQSAAEVYEYRRRRAFDKNVCIEALQSLPDAGDKERADEFVVESERRVSQRPTSHNVARVEVHNFGDVEKSPRAPSDWTNTHVWHAAPLSTGDEASGSAFAFLASQRNTAFNEYRMSPSVLDASDSGTPDAVVPTMQLHRSAHSPTARRLPTDSRTIDPSSLLTNDRRFPDGVRKPMSAGVVTEVDQLAAFLREVDPNRMMDSETRRMIMSRLGEHELPSNHGGSKWPYTEPITRVMPERRPFTEPLMVGRPAEMDDAVKRNGPDICPSCGGKSFTTGGCCANCLRSSQL